ncbi:MAG: N-acetyl-gamma-glutamyl-phosphate reductase [Chloroflexi bacterium]|nr:N-acetyl-gamma-glutamyl-phosphate reductase [Chloroflexota bacterium]
MIKAGIINVTGYAGMELARILHRHPDVKLVSVTGRSLAGQKLGDAFPHLRAVDLQITPEVDRSIDVAFSALPHAASAESLGPLVKDGVKAVDISADFRLKSVTDFEAWYKVKHPHPELIEEAVYGVTEIHRDKIARTRLVANPGCFPMGAILGLAPAVKEGWVEPAVIVDAKTGISGAGRTSDAAYGFSELNDNSSAYGLGGHRHEPEMTQELGALAKSGGVSVTFVPHLVPMTRGILGTCYATLVEPRRQVDVVQLYRDFYANEPFVSVVSKPPATKQTWGNNDCLVYPVVNEKKRRLVVVTALDNLVKGAAGSGIQNMNVMCGLPETAGLEALAIYP